MTGNLLGDDLEKQLKTMEDMRNYSSGVALHQQNKALTQKHTRVKRDYLISKTVTMVITAIPEE